jgi:hypothetical protein
MGDRYGRSIWEIGNPWDIVGDILWNMGYRYGIRYIDMVIHHIDTVIRDIDMEYGLMIWEMRASI